MCGYVLTSTEELIMENRKQNKKVSEIKNILSKFKRAVIKYRPMTYRGINTGGEQIYERDWCITTSRFYTIIGSVLIFVT